ncbi:MAG: ParB N-terminal domain-containing protein [Lachnospiraceae bacterium]|nr:ParB N-terminal domain-containing protein [Lachnospiraceae bacterium]
MAFNILDIVNGTTKAAVGENKEYKDIVLNYKDIVITKHNNYSMEDLEEMAMSIEMDGIQEPLILGRVNGEWWLASGHRRYSGTDILVKEGKSRFENVPCRYKDMTELEFRIALLVGNTFNRKMTDYDLMNQAREWKEVLNQARKEGLIVLEKGQRIRDYVVAILGESDGKVATLEAINNKAVPEVKAEFEKGRMGITAAYSASQLPPEEQKEIAEQAAAGQDVKCDEIKARVEEKKNRREEEAKAQNVSDTDTAEEEKANAKKLHAVKMIEKYYIYLNDEEVGILERMLEDCKRRKREYALDEE